MDTLLKRFPIFSKNIVLPSVQLMKAQRGMKRRCFVYRISAYPSIFYLSNA